MRLLLLTITALDIFRDLDEGLAEAVSSLIWVSPRLMTDVSEIRIIGDLLTAKYGKPYGIACRENSVNTISSKLIQKMSVQAPPKVLVEKYLIEIAKIYNVHYEPDQRVLDEANPETLIEFGEDSRNNLGGGQGGSGTGGGSGGEGAAAVASPPGFVGFPYMPPPPGEFPRHHHPQQPFQYPNVGPAEAKLPLDGPPQGNDHGNVFNIPPGPGLPQGYQYVDPGFTSPSNTDKVLNTNFQVKHFSWASNWDWDDDVHESRFECINCTL